MAIPVAEGSPAPRSSARTDVVFVALALASGVLLLYLGRSLTFWYDEWRSITFNGGPLDYLRPVNEHWSTLPLLFYRATFAAVGLHSYLPYLAEVIALHLVAVAGVYVLARARLEPWVAVLIVLPLFLLGAGSENLFWAFQTGFVGSVAFGVWALFFVERRSRWAPLTAAFLLLAAVASSGIGLCFLAVAAGRTALTPALKRRLLVVVPASAVYVVWFLTLGRDPVGDTGGISGPVAVARFVIRGIGYGSEEFAGLDQVPGGLAWGLLLFVVIALLTGYRVARGHDNALAAGCLFGVGVLYFLIGIVRADLGTDFAPRSRYIYVAGFLFVLAVVDLLSEQAIRGAWPARRRAGLVGVLGLLLLSSVLGSLDDLRERRAEFQYQADFTRAYVNLAVERGREQWVDHAVAYGGVMPPIEKLVSTVARHGSPLRDDLVPGVVTEPDPRAVEDALLVLLGDGFRVEPSTRIGAPLDVRVVAANDVAARRRGGCVQASAAGPAPTLSLSAPPNSRVRMESRSRVAGSVQVGHREAPSRLLELDLERGRAVDIVVPDIGDGLPWTLQMNLAGVSGRVVFCGVRSTG